MFEANRWHSDPLYQAPMAIVGDEHVFLGDIVHLQQGDRYAKVRKFLTMVRQLIQIYTNLIFYSSALGTA